MSKVSVVVPTFNRAYCLPETLDSVFAQTHQDFEIIIVDDGSTDDTRAMLEARYPDPRLRYVHQANGGVSAARNTALALVEGDFVAFLDSDDLWLPHKLELQLACFEAFPEAVLAWTNMIAVDADGRVVDEAYLRSYYHTYSLFGPGQLFEAERPLAAIAPALAETVGAGVARFGDIYGPMVLGSLVHTSTVMLRAETMRAVGNFDLDLKISGEDHDYHLRTCRQGPAVLADVSTIHYRIGHEDQLTRPEYTLHIARNYLRTMQKALAEDRGRLRLPEDMLVDARARAHAWIGEALLDAGEAGALKHIVESLRLRPRQPRMARLAIAAALPRPVSRLARAAWGKLRALT